MSYFNNFVHIICLVICLFIHSLHIYLCIYSYIYREFFFFFFLLWMDVFRDRILSTLCLLFVPEEGELYLLETLDVFSVILCSFSVDLLWNNVAVFQYRPTLFYLWHIFILGPIHLLCFDISTYVRPLWSIGMLHLVAVGSWVGLPLTASGRPAKTSAAVLLQLWRSAGAIRTCSKFLSFHSAKTTLSFPTSLLRRDKY